MPVLGRLGFVQMSLIWGIVNKGSNAYAKPMSWRNVISEQTFGLTIDTVPRKEDAMFQVCSARENIFV